jgi:hypothetical protein
MIETGQDLRPARFGGLPVVPDRAAFGAAVENEAKGNQAENNGQSPGHTHPPSRATARIVSGNLALSSSLTQNRP